MEYSGKLCASLHTESLEVGLQEMFESGGSQRRMLDLGGWGKFRWDIHFVVSEIFIVKIYSNIICETQK